MLSSTLELDRNDALGRGASTFPQHQPGGGSAAGSSRADSSRREATVVTDALLEKRISELERRERNARSVLDQKWRSVSKPVVLSAAAKLTAAQTKLEDDVACEDPPGTSGERSGEHQFQLYACLEKSEAAKLRCRELRQRLALQQHARATTEKLLHMERRAKSRKLEDATDCEFLAWLLEKLSDFSTGRLLPANCRRLPVALRVQASLEQSVQLELNALDKFFEELFEIGVVVENKFDEDLGTEQAFKIRVRVLESEHEHLEKVGKFWASLERFPELWQRRADSVVQRVTGFLRDHFLSPRTPSRGEDRGGSLLMWRVEDCVESAQSARGRTPYCAWKVAAVTEEMVRAAEDARKAAAEQEDEHTREAREYYQRITGYKPKPNPPVGLFQALLSLFRFLRQKMALTPEFCGNRIWSATAQALMRGGGPGGEVGGEMGGPRRQTLDLRRARSKDLDVAAAGQDKDEPDDNGAALDKISSSWATEIEALETATRESGLHDLSVVGNLLNARRRVEKVQKIGNLIEEARRLLFRTTRPGAGREDGGREDDEADSFWRLLKGVLTVEAEIGEGSGNFLDSSCLSESWRSQSLNLKAAQDLISLFVLVRTTQRGDLSTDAVLCVRFFRDCAALCDFLEDFALSFCFDADSWKKRTKKARQARQTRSQFLLKLCLQLRHVSESALRALLATHLHKMKAKLQKIAVAENVNEVSTALGESLQGVKELLQRMEEVGGDPELGKNLVDLSEIRLHFGEEFCREFATFFDRFKQSTLDDKIMEALLHLQGLGVPEEKLLQFQTFLANAQRR